MQKQEIKVELKRNGKKVQVGHSFLESIIRDIPDTKENKKIFEILSHSGNHEIRSDIARNDFLNKKTIKILLNDESDEVIDDILNNSKATKLITQKQIDKIINKVNIKLLTKIAEEIDDYKDINQYKIIKKLVKHPNSKVRYGLLDFRTISLVPISIIKILKDDNDFDVSRKAKEELKDRLSN